MNVVDWASWVSLNSSKEYCFHPPSVVMPFELSDAAMVSHMNHEG